jgi:hypothetical protein
MKNPSWRLALLLAQGPATRLVIAAMLVFLPEAAIVAQTPPPPRAQPVAEQPAASSQSQNPSPVKKPNAALIYREAIRELKQAFAAAEEPYLDQEQGEDLNTPAWRDAVATAAVAISLFTQASQIPHCKFALSDDQLTSELVASSLDYMTLRNLVFVHGYQQIADNPRGACATAMQLLRHADHYAQDQTLLGCMFALAAEGQAILLLTEALPRLARRQGQQEFARTLLKQIGLHVATRPTLVTLADAYMHELTWALDRLAKQLPASDDVRLLREQALAHARLAMKPLRESPAITPEALGKHVRSIAPDLASLLDSPKLTKLLSGEAGQLVAAAWRAITGLDQQQFASFGQANLEELEDVRLQLRQLARSR